MHPAMFERLRHARRAAQAWAGAAGCGPSACGSGGQGWWGAEEQYASPPDHDGDFGGGPFGVRRPLRVLAHRLELDDKQVAELARILSDLKTERAQVAVDHRRSTAAFADAMAEGVFDPTKVGNIATERVKSAERLRDALVQALGKIHALLTAEQRDKFAYLIRTGALSL